MNPSRNELWSLYTQKKSQEIRNQLVESYFSLVKQETQKIKTPVGIERQDIFQFGILGLIKAVDNCDPDKVEKFEAYASIRIRGEIVDHLRQYAKHSQGVSRTTLERIKKMERIKNEIEMLKNDKANEKEVMDYLKLDEKEFSKLQLKTLIYNGMSIDDFYENPNYEKKIDKSDDAENQMLEDEKKQEVKIHLNHLKEKEKCVIDSYYFQHKNISTIAKELGVSEARVSQLHHDGINKLRKLLNNE